MELKAWVHTSALGWDSVVDVEENEVMAHWN